MVLTRQQKHEVVDNLASVLRAASSWAVASFRSLTMVESERLRRSLRQGGGRLRVVPKRLFRRAADALGWPAAFAETEDSLLVAWSEDLTAPAKALQEYVKAHQGDARLLGGVLQNKALTSAEVTALASLPSVEALRGQLVSVLAGPMRGLLAVCAGVLRGLPAVLQAKAKA